MSRFMVTNLPFQGLRIIERQRLSDDRGFLSRLFCATELAAAGWHRPIAQINHTATSQRGTVRGLHYQCPPHAEVKLVTCLNGKSWHVAVDLRAGSPTLLQWHVEILSAIDNRALLIPEGFAHGYQTLCTNVELLYFHTAAYHPSAEAALNARDPRLAIPWPLEITELSPKDAMHPLINSKFEGISP